MSIAQQIGLWADKLRNIAAEGLRYSSSNYDTDRYQATQDTSMEMFAMATGQSVEELEPSRSTVFARISPISGGGGAVIDDDGRILLIL